MKITAKQIKAKVQGLVQKACRTCAPVVKEEISAAVKTVASNKLKTATTVVGVGLFVTAMVMAVNGQQEAAKKVSELDGRVLYMPYCRVVINNHYYVKE